jgi:CTP synthase
MVIEFARNVAGMSGANSTEFDANTKSPVISTMAEQVAVVKGDADMGGSMRLGLYPAILGEGTVVRELYGDNKIEERHRHRYEVNAKYRPQLEKAGLVFSGESPDGALVEFVELPAKVHPFYVGTQAHPEFRSRPTHAHPLFKGLVAAGVNRRNAVT